jgi:hypothetical protein
MVFFNHLLKYPTLACEVETYYFEHQYYDTTIGPNS